MTNPLHPMHQHLLARVSGASASADEQGKAPSLQRPLKMAIAFYAAIGAWGLVWLAIEGARLFL